MFFMSLHSYIHLFWGTQRLCSKNDALYSSFIIISLVLCVSHSEQKHKNGFFYPIVDAFMQLVALL